MDLNAPLGMQPTQRSRRVTARLAPVAVVAVGLLAGFGYVLAKADPHGGEPYAVVALPPLRPAEPVDPMPTGSAAVRPNAPSISTGRDQSPAEGTLENGVRVFRGTGPTTTSVSATPQGPLVIDVTHQLDGGLKPFGDRPGFDSATRIPAETQPRIAIYVGGMGLSQSATQTAIDSMPPEVTLAFLPYAATTPALIQAAKAKGHEILLQLPMQNAQGGAPGPHALTADESPAALASDLEWLTTRFGGYVGITNLLGGPVTSNTAAMTAVLRAANARNLFFLDDGTSKRSIAASVAAQLNVPEVQADVVLDATSDPAVVRARLDSLVAIARRKGQAIGMASGLPDYLTTIARFAADLRAKNVMLVPVSALARRDTNVATKAR